MTALILTIPELSLVLLIGVSSSGKTTFARQHFKDTQVVSSDHCRAMISDNENDQTVTPDAFEILHLIVEKRLAKGRLTIVDATNIQAESRKSLLMLAKKYHFSTVAIVFDLDSELYLARNQQREDRRLDPAVIERQLGELKQSLSDLKHEHHRYIYIFKTPEDVKNVSIKKQYLWCNKKIDRGPFDIIGGIHGCYDELLELLDRMDYHVSESDNGKISVHHPEDRKLVFIGDIVDRGPKIPQVLTLIMDTVKNKIAYCIPGNHEQKLLKKLSGETVSMDFGLDDTLEQLAACPEKFQRRVEKFLGRLVVHYVFDFGYLVVAHAGMKIGMQGRASAGVRQFALYGETWTESDVFGPEIRPNWALNYHGRALVVYAHPPVPKPLWIGNTININTGCVFGGHLTAYRHPEKEIISVPAHRKYYESSTQPQENIF